MKELTKEDKLKILNEWFSNIRATDDTLSKISDVFRCGGCGCLEEFEKLQEAYTKSIEAILGDGGGWLMWYWLDNKMGTNHYLTTTVNGERVSVKSLEDLLKVMS